MKEKKQKSEPEIEALLSYTDRIIATLREPFLILDKNLRIISANQAFYTTFEVKEKDTIGRPLPDLGDRQWNIPKLLQLLKEILPEKKVMKDYEVGHKFEKIGQRAMILNACQLRVPKKIAVIIAAGVRKEEEVEEELILLAIEDITARREVENGLEKARKELATTKISEDAAREYAESIINTVREPLIALDQDLRVVSASRSFYDVFMVNPTETVGQLIYDLGNKQWDIPKLRELLETILPQRATFDNYEVEHDFTTIGRRIMLLNARQIQRVLGKERIILLAIEDITERKQLEEKMKKLNAELEERVSQRTKELSTAVKEMEAFSYSVAHDLKTPLRAIAGFANILLEDYAPKLDDNAIKVIGVIDGNVKKMGQLIEDLLKLAHLARLATAFTDIDVTTLVQSVCHELREGPFRDRAMEVSVKPLPHTKADPTLAKQIFTNLISNAMKFTAHKEKAVIEVGGYGKDGECVYYVKDNGAGFDMKYVDKLFGIFQRLHAQDEFSGTGIGLAIVRNAIQRHGGRVWAEGEVGQGATFYFTLSGRGVSPTQSP
jgi:PAS domain S-box-containing protein